MDDITKAKEIKHAAREFSAEYSQEAVDRVRELRNECAGAVVGVDFYKKLMKTAKSAIDEARQEVMDRCAEFEYDADVIWGLEPEEAEDIVSEVTRVFESHAERVIDELSTEMGHGLGLSAEPIERVLEDRIKEME